LLPRVSIASLHPHAATLFAGSCSRRDGSSDRSESALSGARCRSSIFTFRATGVRNNFAGSCRHATGRDEEVTSGLWDSDQRRRRARGCVRGLWAGEVGGGSPESSFGLSLDRYDSPSMTKS